MTTKVIWKEVRKTPDVNALLPYAHTLDVHTQMNIQNTHAHMYTNTHTQKPIDFETRYKDGYKDGCTTVSMCNESN